MFCIAYGYATAGTTHFVHTQSRSHTKYTAIALQIRLQTKQNNATPKNASCLCCCFVIFRTDKFKYDNKKKGQK